MKKYFIFSIIALLSTFAFVACGGNNSPYKGESMSFPTEIESNENYNVAASMAWLRISIEIGGNVDFSHRHITVEPIGDDAYKIAGRCFYDNKEHLYEIRTHHTGDDPFNLQQWEYSVLYISNIDRTEIECKKFGTWNGDYE